MQTVPIYPQGVVRSLLQTGAVTPATRTVLCARLRWPQQAPLFFTSDQFYLLSVVCDLLMAQDSNNRIAPIAEFIDGRLARGAGKGWRYNHLPPDSDLYPRGLSGIDQTSKLLFHLPFVSLDKPNQIKVLLSIQRGVAPGIIWQLVSPVRFFEELLTEVTEVFFSHPLVQESFGYVGMADGPGWVQIGLDEKEDREPAEIIITRKEDA